MLDFYTIDGDTTYIHLHNLGMELEANILQPPAPVVSDATAHWTFGPTDLTSTSEGICGHRTQAFRFGVRCSDHLATHGPIIHNYNRFLNGVVESDKMLYIHISIKDKLSNTARKLFLTFLSE
ncbi:hypothetical protein TNCV_5078031 [Trichonephila clavipes]|uniref:Uncharacterized protein n=1 Tax=Trichonephila clavipes TaxID=2585209 RepID=A0A8X6RT82_TRICX|nr:hypothetical protein TNCV_5078031 [Trichonephila clavipes]